MRAEDIIRLIDENLEDIKSAEDKKTLIIRLLEQSEPSCDNFTAYGSDEDFLNLCSAMSGITRYVILGLKNYDNVGEIICIPESSLGEQDAEEVNVALGYIYNLLKTYK